MTTRLGTRATTVTRPLIAPTVAPMAMPSRKPSSTGMCGWFLNVMPTTYADRPTTDPTDRSTLRVTMTSVSPTPSSAINAAPVSSCCTLAAWAKAWLLIVVTAKTTRMTMPMPSSRARNNALARANRLTSGTSTGASAVVLMR